MEKQQTAVEWLSEQLWKTPQYETEWQKIIEQAKEMEKQQMKEAYLGSYTTHPFFQKFMATQFEQYYYEKFNKPNQ